MDKQNLEFIRLLQSSGWTQAKAAQELGLTTGAISQFMSGTARPKTTVIRLFKLLLGDTSSFTEDYYPATKAEKEVLPLDGKEVELLRELRKLEGLSRRQVVSAVRILVGAVRAKH